MSEEQDLQSSSPSEVDSSDNEDLKVGTNVAVNPFFDKTKRTKLENKSEVSNSESDSDSFSESDDDSDFSDNDDSDDKKEEPEVDDEDPLIKALKKSKEKSERKSPPDLSCNDISDLSFHPSCNLIAHCDINGKIFLNEYNNEENNFKYKQKGHKGAVRSLEFDNSGSFIVSGGVDKSFQLIDTETFKTVLKVTDSHDAALYKIKSINENLLVTGDEDGTVKLWDRRHSSNMSKSVMEDTESLDDAITDFFHKNQDPNYLIASSAEGLIQGYNLAGKKADVQSEVYGGEMNTMGIGNQNKNVFSYHQIVLKSIF